MPTNTSNFPGGWSDEQVQSAEQSLALIEQYKNEAQTSATNSAASESSCQTLTQQSQLNSDTSTTNASSASASATEAEASKNASALIEQNVTTMQTAVNTAKAASEAARDKSQQWAENAEDVEVETGKFSSMHHANKANASATSASDSKDVAVAKAEEAAASAASNNAADIVHAPGSGLSNEAGSAYASDVTESPTDTTAGRLLKVGDDVGLLSGIGRKNLLINGDHRIWQCGDSFTANGYASDQWVNSTGGSFNRGTMLTVDGQTRECASITFGGNGYKFFEQRIEYGTKVLQGKTVTLSFEVSGDLSGSVGVISSEEGDNQSINFGSFDITATTTKVELTATIPSNVTNLSSFRYIRFFVLNAENYTGSLSITNVQFEFGAKATDFDYRPVGYELLLCMRYFQYIYHGAYETLGIMRSGGSGILVSDRKLLPVPMRAIPTISGSLTTAGSITTGSLERIDNSQGVQSLSGVTVYDDAVSGYFYRIKAEHASAVNSNGYHLKTTSAGYISWFDARL